MGFPYKFLRIILTAIFEVFSSQKHGFVSNYTCNFKTLTINISIESRKKILSMIPRTEVIFTEKLEVDAFVVSSILSLLAWFSIYLKRFSILWFTLCHKDYASRNNYVICVFQNSTWYEGYTYFARNFHNSTFFHTC